MRGSTQDCYLTGSIVVADTSAFITGFVRAIQGMIYTTSSVISEVKDEYSKEIVELLSNAGRLYIQNPDKEYVDIVKKVASEISTLNKLSETDIDVLALALYLKDKLGCEIHLITDDYTLQYTATYFKLKLLRVRYRGIKDKPL